MESNREKSNETRSGINSRGGGLQSGLQEQTLGLQRSERTAGFKRNRFCAEKKL